MHCELFDSQRCRSCSALATPYAAQLATKDRDARRRLAPDVEIDWMPPRASAEARFRNKAKMVVAGSIERPTLGILDGARQGVDLVRCPLYPHALAVSFEPIRAFISVARVAPYNVVKRRGELKYVLITLSEHSGELMIRFVLRSNEAIGRMRKQLFTLSSELPQARVISINLQPEHKAIIEGDSEILLSADERLEMRLNGITHFLRPGGFFQTNTAVAEALYAQATQWVNELAPHSVWDLYCGVGSFALHCAAAERVVSGFEFTAESIRCAQEAAAMLGVGVHFERADASRMRLAPNLAPDLLIVNPPRRGIGLELCQQIAGSRARHLLYSSCNPESLAHDLQRLPMFELRRARVFDMFPHTAHCEVLTLLERRASS